MIPKNQTCEGFDCGAHASEQIEVSAGRFGAVTLFMCEICADNFLDEKKSAVGTNPSSADVPEPETSGVDRKSRVLYRDN